MSGPSIVSSGAREGDVAHTVAGSRNNDRLDPSIWKICIVAVMGSLLSQLDATIVNVSLSNLASDLHASLSTIQWVMSGYLLALTLVLPLNGWMVDRMGAKAVYLWSFSAFTITSMLCGFAWSANSLIAFRLLQGMSGGLLAPMAQLMMTRAAGKHMARVVGYMSLPVMLAPILGPIVAGLILQHASWRWLFFVNLPVGLIALVLAVLFLPNDKAETTRRNLDWVGLALLSPGLALFLYGIERAREIIGVASLVAGIVMMLLFVWTARRRGDKALVDVRLFKIKAFATGTVTLFLWNGVVFVSQLLIPAFLIQGFARAPTEMGWMLMALGVGMTMSYPFMGRLTDRFGLRDVTLAGVALTIAATLPLFYVAERGLSMFVLLPALFFRGVGQGAVGLPTLTASYAAIRRKDLPMATTSLNIVQRLGGPTMTTLVASFLAWRLGVHATDGGAMRAFSGAFVLLCGLQVVTLLAAIGLPKRREDVAVVEG